ncbi:hypothetical protein CLV47_13510 [Antricoccus suffuscus]|uniref:Uncharacterized protein n=1 Tax=Antricoccus suffuscus TaxID=1629062 RepID=A0A2T0YYP4_9ACTN|nr:hypothetical protein [Antricoccus suffuscus]PRZ29216.1 hypothetical protein CLV47_13510 [Antricoccus suffuscus]
MTGAIDPRHYPPRRLPPTTRDTTRARLRAVPKIDPRERFGPQYAELTRLVETAATIEPEQGRAIENTWYQHRGRRRFAARSAASSAAAKAGRLICQIDARQAAWSASELPSRDAAGDAAHALAVRDLIGEIFTHEDYDELVLPWVATMGAIHPQDGAA